MTNKTLKLNQVLLKISDKLHSNDYWQEAIGSSLFFIKMTEDLYKESTIFKWDLTKETLEEQSEETQREINKLLTQ